MKKSLFDSDAEKSVFKTLTSRWARYAELYPQVPVRKVLGYEAIRQLELPEKATNYLLSAEFDFVACYRGSSQPFLAIEFDGMGGGYSHDWKYVPIATPINDPYRSLKLDRKLEACQILCIPLIIVSYPETASSRETII